MACSNDTKVAFGALFVGCIIFCVSIMLNKWLMNDLINAF